MKKILQRTIAVFLLALFPNLVWNQVPESNIVVIEGGTLIDGNGGPPVLDSRIIIRGNRIESVTRKGQTPIPAGAQVLQADGKFILPGLMDAHVHYQAWMGELFLNHGVTSVFEIGGGGELGLLRREALRRGKIPGPREFLAVGSISGQKIAAVRGAVGLGGPLASRQVVDSPEKAREILRRFLDAGADYLKVHRGPPVEVYRAAAEEAHKAGKALVVQALGPTVYAREAVLAGADILEHAAGVEYSVARDPSKWKDWGSIEAHSISPVAWIDMDEGKAADLIQLMVQRNVFLEPDFVARGRSLFDGSDKRFRYELQDHQLLSRPSLAYLPRWYRVKWERNYHEFDDLPAGEQQERVQGLRNMMRFIAQFVKAGGKVLSGTDVPGWAVAGLSLHHELDMLVAAGLTPMQAITASTKNVAEGFRLRDNLGTVEAGKWADLLVVNADPLQDINNLDKIEWVIQNGRIVNQGYHAWFSTPFELLGVQGLSWYQALSRQTMNADPTWAFGWPPPGIGAMSPTVVQEGDPAQTLTLKGVNFVQKSIVFFQDQPLPTKFISGNEVQATLDAGRLARPGSYAITVRNPEPLQRPEWGNGTSNKAYLIVNFRY